MDTTPIQRPYSHSHSPTTHIPTLLRFSYCSLSLTDSYRLPTAYLYTLTGYRTTALTRLSLPPSIGSSPASASHAPASWSSSRPCARRLPPKDSGPHLRSAASELVERGLLVCGHSLLALCKLWPDRLGARPTHLTLGCYRHFRGSTHTPKG